MNGTFFPFSCLHLTHSCKFRSNSPRFSPFVLVGCVCCVDGNSSSFSSAVVAAFIMPRNESGKNSCQHFVLSSPGPDETPCLSSARNPSSLRLHAKEDVGSQQQQQQQQQQGQRRMVCTFCLARAKRNSLRTTTTTVTATATAGSPTTARQIPRF